MILRPHARRRRARGMSFIEVTMALSVVTIALVATLTAISNSTQAARVVTERDAALRACTAKMDEIAASTFADIYKNYDSVASNDPNGSGTAPGATWLGASLPFAKGKKNQPNGTITLPTKLVSGVTQIREDVVVPELGMPRDLNGDGVIDSADHSADYKLIPVLLTIQWPKGNTTMTYKYASLISAK